MEKRVISNTDVTDLVTELIEGPFETPLWRSFLDTLRRRSEADCAILVLQPPGRPMNEGLQLIAGETASSEIARMHRKYFYPLDPVRREWVEEGKPYSLDDLLRLDQESHSAFYHVLIEKMGIKSVWQIRVCEPNGLEAWLIIARSGDAFAQSAPEVLAAIAPALRGTLRNYVAGERNRIAVTMTADAVRRMQCGWLLLDRDCHVLSADPFGELILSDSGVLQLSGSGRLAVNPPELERDIFSIVARLAVEAKARPHPISLRADPWLDMLLVPARKTLISTTSVPAVVAYVHRDNWHSADRCGQLVDLFGLSRSEARLALAICRGKSIAEAADEVGIVVETARGYSKAIYAKTGARGMADLVRLIMGSIFALTPDD